MQIWTNYDTHIFKDPFKKVGSYVPPDHPIAPPVLIGRTQRVNPGHHHAADACFVVGISDARIV